MVSALGHIPSWEAFFKCETVQLKKGCSASLTGYSYNGCFFGSIVWSGYLYVQLVVNLPIFCKFIYYGVESYRLISFCWCPACLTGVKDLRCCSDWSCTCPFCLILIGEFKKINFLDWGKVRSFVKVFFIAICSNMGSEDCLL